MKNRNSNKWLINLSLFGVIVLTILLTFTLVIELYRIRPVLIFRLGLFFQENRWWIMTAAIIGVVILLIAVFAFSMQSERFLSLRIRKMYKDLETGTLRGIINLPIGVISYEDKNIVWANDFFTKQQRDDLIGKPTSLLALEQSRSEIHDTERNWIYYPKVAKFGRVLDIYHDLNTQIIYFLDCSSEYAIADDAIRKEIVIGYVYADSPDEIRVMDDSGNYDISSEIHRTLLQWAQKYNAYVRKYSSYRWMVITNRENLMQMIADEMNVRETIKNLSDLLKTNLTISGGFSEYHHNLGNTVGDAIDAIELGQSRGGDQIVIYKTKGEQKELIFGGDNNQKKRTSRVMARSTAVSLHSAIEKYKHIYITGHQFADFDAVGAMLGIGQIVTALKKDVKYIIDEEKFDLEMLTLIDKVFASTESVNWPTKIIQPRHFDVRTLPEDSVIIIVDTTAPNLLENENIANAPHIIIIDHHRKTKNSIKGVEIEYIDPFSSSVSEMVTELIQYQPVEIEIPVEVATFMLAGIILDTNQFTRQVSSRTFEAASFLRKHGALQDLILQVISTNIKDYMAKSKLLSNTVSVPKGGLVLALDGENSRTDIAKCADFLLSFRETRYAVVVSSISETKLSMSARSKGSMNVQKIMEYFGGGGHYNNAAAQIENRTASDVSIDIIEYINQIISQEQNTKALNSAK